MLLVVSSASAIGCAAHRAQPVMVAPTEALVRTGSVSAASTGLTTAYRRGVGLGLFSDCKFRPTDSRYFDAAASSCGTVSAIYLTSARMLLEHSIDATLADMTIADGRMRWLDEPPVCGKRDEGSNESSGEEIGVSQELMSVTTCGAKQCGRQVALMRELLRSGRPFDAHVTGLVADAMCDCAGGEWQYWHGVALWRLQDTARAMDLWHLLADSSAVAAPLRERAALALVWAYDQTHDDQAAAQARKRLAPSGQYRADLWMMRGKAVPFAKMLAAATPTMLPLGATTQSLAWEAAAYRDARHHKKPWLAATLSTVLPGSGQLYAGAYESAAVSFLLSSLLIAATVEFARDEKYFAASAMGFASSVFYIGGIFNAADTVRRRNGRRAAEHETRLQETLFPELLP